MSGPGRGSGRRRRRRRPKQSTILIFLFFLCVSFVFVPCFFPFDRTGLYNVRNVRGFPRFFSFLEKDVVSARGREIDTPHLHLLRMEWPRQTHKTGFQHRPTLLSTRKATRKISGGVAQMVERSLSMREVLGSIPS